MFLMIVPPAISGLFVMGLIPVLLLTIVVTVFIKGYIFLTPDTDPMGINWPIFENTRKEYKDLNIDQITQFM